MARRPQHQVKDIENAEVIYTPCGFCCTMMEVPKEIYTKGGLFRCKKCGMGVRYKPHKIVVKKNTRKFNFRSRIEAGIETFGSSL